MQLCTAKSRLGIKIADTHRLTPKETVNRHSPVNIYIQHCATYTQHLLLRAGILVPSQGSILHNSFCRRAKTKKKQNGGMWKAWHKGRRLLSSWHFLHQLTYISSRLVWKKSLIWSPNNSKHNSKAQREVKSLEANQTTIWAFDFESLCLINGWEVKNELINIKMWEAKYTACQHCAYIRFIHLKNTKLPIWQNMPCPPNLCLFLLCL